MKTVRIVIALSAACVCGVPLASEIESAAGGAVEIGVGRSSRAAAVVVWPPVRDLVPPGGHPTALRIALRVAGRAAGRSAAGTSALYVDEGGTLAAGLETARGSEAAILEALETIASPADVPDAVIEEIRLEQAAGRPAKPIDIARRSVLDRLAGIPHPDPRGTIPADEVRAALRVLREAPVRVVGVGSAGLARRIAGRLSGRLAAGSPSPSREPGDASRGVIIPAASASAVIVVGYRADAALARELGAAAPVVAEVLRDGPGSLRQRLSVAIEDPVVLRVDLVPLGGGREGALLIQAGVPAERAERAYDVIDGAVSSLGALAPRQAALVEARSRLDASAAALQGAAGRDVAERMLLPGSWRWPPEDRWSAPLGPDGFAASVRRLLVRELSSVAVAGRVPQAFAERAPFTSGRAAGEGVPTSDGSGLLARVARSVVPGGVESAERGFSSRYAVSEETPLGRARSTLAVRSEAGDVSVAFETGGRTTLDPPPEGAALSGRERRLALAMRQPAILLAMAESGLAIIDEVDASCGEGTCAALIAELDDGTQLELLIDRSSGLPLELRTRWCCVSADDPADQTLRFVEWLENDGVRLASRIEAVDAGGGSSMIELVDWRWKADGLHGDPR